MDKEVWRNPRHGKQHSARHRDTTHRPGRGHRDVSSKACSKWHLGCSPGDALGRLWKPF